MSLECGAATSDVAGDMGSPASTDDLAAFSVIFWAWFTTLTSGRSMGSKGVAGTNGWNMRLPNGTGDIELRWLRATTNYQYVSNTSPIATGQWWCIMFTAAQAAAGHIYVGDETTALAEVGGYSTSTQGSGAFASDAAGNLRIGNLSTLVNAIEARLAHWAIFGAQLSAADGDLWRKRPRSVIAGNTALARYFLGAQGAGDQTDYSGNGITATPAGCTQHQSNPKCGVILGPQVLDPFGLVSGGVVT